MQNNPLDELETNIHNAFVYYVKDIMQGKIKINTIHQCCLDHYKIVMEEFDKFQNREPRKYQ